MALGHPAGVLVPHRLHQGDHCICTGWSHLDPAKALPELGVTAHLEARACHGRTRGRGPDHSLRGTRCPLRGCAVRWWSCGCSWRGTPYGTVRHTSSAEARRPRRESAEETAGSTTPNVIATTMGSTAK